MLHHSQIASFGTLNLDKSSKTSLINQIHFFFLKQVEPFHIVFKSACYFSKILDDLTIGLVTVGGLVTVAVFFLTRPVS